MNRKDLKTLSESYGRIFENTISGLLNNQSEDEINGMDRDHSNLEVPVPQESPSNISIGISGNDGEEQYEGGCSETNEMNITKLKSLIAHSNKVLSMLEGGKEVDPWMTDKITVASEYILDVSNVLEFGN